MDNILEHAILTRHCNECGGTYELSLYAVLQNQRLKQEWQNPLPCEECTAEVDELVRQLNPETLEAVDSAWRRMAEELAAHSVQLQLR